MSCTSTTSRCTAAATRSSVTSTGPWRRASTGCCWDPTVRAKPRLPGSPRPGSSPPPGRWTSSPSGSGAWTSPSSTLALVCHPRRWPPVSRAVKGSWTWSCRPPTVASGAGARSTTTSTWSAPTPCWAPWAQATWPTASGGRCPPGSASASSWPAPSCRTRRCSSSTSRPRVWTWPAASSSCPRSRRSSPRRTHPP